MTHFSCFKNLNNFKCKFRSIDKFRSFLDDLRDSALNLSMIDFFCWCLSRKDILQQAFEQSDIIEDELRHVHVSQGSHEQKFFEEFFLFRGWNVLWFGLFSLCVTSSSEDWKNVSQTEVIMSLFWQLFLTEFIQHVKLFTETVDEFVTDWG